MTKLREIVFNFEKIDSFRIPCWSPGISLGVMDKETTHIKSDPNCCKNKTQFETFQKENRLDNLASNLIITWHNKSYHLIWSNTLTL